MSLIPHSRPWITPADMLAVKRTLGTAMIGQGNLTADLENALSAWVHGRGGVAVASGSAALELALRALQCRKGTEVIMPAYVCRDVYEAIAASGARPVLCDVGPNWLVEPENVTPLITARTSALLLPHLYGLFLDIGRFRRLGVPIIEDCAQALGSKKQSTIQGDIAVFSFHPTKCLTTGEGGMCVTRKPNLLRAMRTLRDGKNALSATRVFSPFSAMAAALGLSQLARYDEFLRRREKIARRYLAVLERYPAIDCSWTQRSESMFFRLPVQLPGGFDRAARRFLRHKIVVRRGVDELLHRLAGLPDARFPNTLKLYHHTLSLPLHPSLTPNEIDRCVRAIKLVFGQA